MRTAPTEADLFAAVTEDLENPPAVDARLVCPETGGIKRVRLAADDACRPSIVRCDRFGFGPVPCKQRCLMETPGASKAATLLWVTTV